MNTASRAGIFVIFFVLSILSSGNSHAQNFMNFQGKAALNNNPINSTTGTLEFWIHEMNWYQPFLGNVTVKNGLFSVTLALPDKVFDSAHGTRRMVVHYNGNLLDTFTVLAPVERDPTVRTYIRDSVQWVNIRNKPTVDTSFTNELQNLSLSGDTLRISNGNAVLLAQRRDTLGPTTVNGKFRVIDTNIVSMVSVSSTSGNYTSAAVYWQSFKATANGRVRKIKLTAGANGGSNVTVSVYPGNDNLGQAIASKNFVITSNAQAEIFDFTTGIQLAPYVKIMNGQTYTIEIKPNPASSTSSINILSDPSNPYINGRSNINANTDLPFEVSIDKSVPAILSVNVFGEVGIGLDSATSQFEVEGRIKDQTGYIMPVGAVLPYAGNALIPEGWLLCDGRFMSRVTYSDLFAAIGTAWGNDPNQPDMFRLPDMRGQFLRGVANSPTLGASLADPEYSLRVPLNPGGSAGNQVGSAQSDALQGHRHGLPVSGSLTIGQTGLFRNNFSDGPSPYYEQGIYTDGTNGTPRISSETRPKNVYVNYIIKY